MARPAAGAPPDTAKSSRGSLSIFSTRRLSQVLFLFVRFALNRGGSTHDSATGPDGPSSNREYPRRRRRWNHERPSRTKAAVVPASRPDEARDRAAGTRTTFKAAEAAEAAEADAATARVRLVSSKPAGARSCARSDPTIATMIATCGRRDSDVRSWRKRSSATATVELGPGTPKVGPRRRDRPGVRRYDHRERTMTLDDSLRSAVRGYGSRPKASSSFEVERALLTWLVADLQSAGLLTVEPHHDLGADLYATTGEMPGLTVALELKIWREPTTKVISNRIADALSRSVLTTYGHSGLVAVVVSDPTSQVPVELPMIFTGLSALLRSVRSDGIGYDGLVLAWTNGIEMRSFEVMGTGAANSISSPSVAVRHWLDVAATQSPPTVSRSATGRELQAPKGGRRRFFLSVMNGDLAPVESQQ
jgi:hypothetical protein